MDLFFGDFRKASFSKVPVFFLAFAWLIGLVFGVVTSFFATDSMPELIESIFSNPNTGFGVLVSVWFTVALFAFAVRYFGCFALGTVVFLKAFFYAFFCCGVWLTFRSSGWLLGILLVFSDTCMLPVLWFYMLHCTDQHKPDLFLSTLFTGSIASLIASIHYSVISPFLMKIITL